jgi:hypothetical protein
MNDLFRILFMTPAVLLLSSSVASHTYTFNNSIQHKQAGKNDWLKNRDQSF